MKTFSWKHARLLLLSVWITGGWTVPSPGLAQDARPVTSATVDKASVKGEWEGDRGSLVIQAHLQGLPEGRDSALYSATIYQAIQAKPDRLIHRFDIEVESLRGSLKEIEFQLSGTGEIRQLTSTTALLQNWGIRQETNGTRVLLVRLAKSDTPVTRLQLQLSGETPVEATGQPVEALAVMVSPAALSSGYLRLDVDPQLDAKLVKLIGLSALEEAALPDRLRSGAGSPQAFRFHGTAYRIPLVLDWADPEAGRVVLRDLKLIGDLQGDVASFTLSAIARVRGVAGGELAVLGGSLALTDWNPAPNWRIRFDSGRYVARFDQAGDFPLEIKFHAAVLRTEGWSGIDIAVARSVLPRVELKGFSKQTQFRWQGAVVPQPSGDTFVSFLPPTGDLKLQWRERSRESQGVLFFSVESLTQVAVRPGLMHQTRLFDYKVMQGELKQVNFTVQGAGEITRVQGAPVLSWAVEPLPNSADRRLVVQLNQGQKDHFTLHVQTQTPLGLFPQSVDLLQVQPDGALRTGGYLRLLNEGAVRLEVLQTSGLSQISPEQFPQTELAKALSVSTNSQVFAYRLAGEKASLRFQADNILPELTASEILLYHYGENDLSVDLDLDLEVREAPLRELTLRVPKGFVVARLTAAGMSDYYLTDSADQADAQLRLIYGTPVLGRQLLSLRLEQNRPPAVGDWKLPRLDLARARSLRGHVGVTADMGFRLTPGKIENLSEIATAFFPKKLAGMQAALRIQDPSWEASLSVERLPQSVQADVFHLFSVGEGIANGSSLIHYLISGAPVSAFRIGLSNEYLNVEFSGKDLRSWQRIEGGYLVQLHSPVSGAYPLLATFERPFRAQGEQVNFAGARPLDAQSEQGHAVIVSAFPFQARSPGSSPGWVSLETGEIPAEYRLFFDSPVLAAYRYTSVPGPLALQLSPLIQGETVNQVVDRGLITTRVSKEGQVITDLHYFVKSKGAPTLRFSVPAGMQLWSVTINGSPVVPVQDGAVSLIPMPQQADPNRINELLIKLAARSGDSQRLTLSLPSLAAPVLLSEWRLEPEAGRRLVYRGGTITPADPIPSETGLRAWMRLLTPPFRPRTISLLGLAAGLLFLAVWVARIATAAESSRFTARHWLGGLVALAGVAGAFFALVLLLEQLANLEGHRPPGLRFVIPVQQPDQPLSIDVQNVTNEVLPWKQPRVLGWLIAAVGLALLSWWKPAHSSARRWGAAGAWLLAALAAGQSSRPGAAWVIWCMALVLAEIVLPCTRAWLNVPRRDPNPPTTPPSPTPALALWLLSAGLILFSTGSSQAADTNASPTRPRRIATPQADRIQQEIRVHDGSAQGQVQVHWQGQAGEVLPLLQAPGVLTDFRVLQGAGRLVEMTVGSKPGFGFRTDGSAPAVLSFNYQIPVFERKEDQGFAVPVVPGMVNRVNLLLTGLDVDVQVPTAISTIRRDAESQTDTRVEIVLAPSSETWIGWKPRSRDTKRERAVFYADWIQVLQPGTGVVDGFHQAEIRPAQGEIGELVFEIPIGATITEVSTPALLQWRFDPASRQLRVVLGSPQAKPFTVRIQSQFSTPALPSSHRSSLIGVAGAAGEIGVLGLMTSAEVQLDEVKAEAFAPINLEDFPIAQVNAWRGASSTAVLRRAFRFGQPRTELTLRSSQVAPDVRVESQQTLSLGDDRTVLAANLDIEISRAGVFKLSFLLPAGFDVESISGDALSHWTELKAPPGRTITLHLKGRTLGRQTFAITLAGAGTPATPGWAPPRLVLLEAEKQRGNLVLIPEQGLKLQVVTRDGVTQLDPGKAGLRQKGVLAFRLLQANWALALNVERVEAWTQVTTLQSVLVAEARVRVGMNFLYEIDNAGMKTLRIALPQNAENVQFTGEQVADQVKLPSAPDNGRSDWEVRLHRRVIGKFVLQLQYQLPLAEGSPELKLLGVMVRDVNLQRGYLALRSKGRLQLGVSSLPAALQATEWQSVPRNLLANLEAETASHVFRLVEPGYELVSTIKRHEAAKLLPARVHSVTLTSAVSDDGATLTRVRLEMTPGDRQLLPLTLPTQAQFWFAFVNQNSVSPWKEKEQLLIPLERSSKGTEPIQVEFFYLARTGRNQGGTLDLSLLGPKLDLPLEKISWRVFLSPKWQVRSWSGSLELQEDQTAPSSPSIDLASYSQSELTVQRAQSQEAEQFLSIANSLLEKGDPDQARRALQSAYGLSRHDNAFNEDARVQLHNLKTQQALVGLNMRQAKVAGDNATLAQVPANLRDGATPAYTQQEAKSLIERNTAEDAAAQRKLVERLIQQQETVVAQPAAIRASLPEQGQRLSFTRGLQVEAWSDLRITLQASETRPFHTLKQLGLLLALLLGVWAIRQAMARSLPITTRS